MRLPLSTYLPPTINVVVYAQLSYSSLRYPWLHPLREYKRAVPIELD